MIISANNFLSVNIANNMNINNKKNTKSTEKLSSGYRINRAADDAAGLSISEKMRNMIRGLDQGCKNIEDGIAFVHTADGAMNEIQAMLGRIRELAVQGANDTNASEDRLAIDDEIQELKRELSLYSERTKFNGQYVFFVPKVEMGIGVSGVPNDFNTFNSSYDSATGEVTYGGILFNGERISWDKIQGGMVKLDENGNQIFKGGEYHYTAPDGTNFTFTCEDGDSVPNTLRKVNVTAGSGGLNIDGTILPWSNLRDEYGVSISDGTIHKGAWAINYKGANLAFFINDEVKNMSDMIEAVNSCHQGDIQYTWRVAYDGPRAENAVYGTTTSISNVTLSNNLASQIKSGKISLTLRADQSGMWLENDIGDAISSSKKTWADLGIRSFNSGSDINSSTTYTYSHSFDNIAGLSDKDDIRISFNLSNVTSVDSIIDGLDGMTFNEVAYASQSHVDITNDSEIGKMKTPTVNIPITPGDEIAFGRDFNVMTSVNLSTASADYDASGKTVSVDFKNNSGKLVMKLSGNVSSQENKLSEDLRAYANSVARNKTVRAMKGLDPQGNENVYEDLKDLVGESKITTSGYMSDQVTLDASMVRSNNFTYGGLVYDYSLPNKYESQTKYGLDGATYAAGKIDFSGLGSSYTLDDLRGLGFDSTCLTCTKHYSVQFVDGLTNSEKKSVPSGYTYSITNNGLNYYMEIDINSLKESGNIKNGSDFTKALVEILDSPADYALDRHYTQYVSSGNTLYACDSRGIDYPKPKTAATFYTRPYSTQTLDTFTFNLNKTVDADPTRTSGSASLTYEFDYKSFEDSIQVNMNQKNDGEYVKLDDGTFVNYDSKKHAAIDASKRYTRTITYKATDGRTLSSLDEAIKDYTSYAMKDMLENTEFKIGDDNYMKYNLRSTAKNSTAIRSTYSSYVEETPYEDIIYIQNSGVAWDDQKVPRFKMTTVSMGIFDAGSRTRKEAENTIKAADRATKYVSACRSRYGAIENRMQHTYNNNMNYSENLTNAESGIRDTDMADEMVNYSKTSILAQAAQSMLSQANQQANSVLNLLQR